MAEHSRAALSKGGGVSDTGGKQQQRSSTSSTSSSSNRGSASAAAAGAGSRSSDSATTVAGAAESAEHVAYEALGCDILHLPYRTGSCDVALCVAVLHHLSTEEHRLRAMAELARIVRPGGTIFVQVSVVAHC